MPQPLHVLLVEDNAADAELVERTLELADFDPQIHRVDTEPAFVAALNGNFDIILSDHQMPQFTGMRALELVNERGIDLPFIIVSGMIGEEAAVLAMKKGAVDYLLKDRLARLGPAVRQALEQRDLRHERTQVETALRRSEIDFRLLFADNPMPMWVYDIETLRFLAVNKAAIAHYGYSNEEFLGQTIIDIRPPEDVPALMASIAEVPLKLERSGVWRHRTKDGQILVVEIASHPISFQRRPAKLVLVKDVTQQRRSETALRESEERFRQVAENIHEVFWMTDVDKNRMIYVSPGYEAIWGRSCASLLAQPRTWVESVHPEDRARVLAAALTQQVRGEYDEIYRIVRPDGATRWIRDRAFPVRNEKGETYRVVGLAENITERKHAEEVLLETERRFREMLENVELIAMTLDRSGTITFCNDHLLRLTGWRREEAIGENWFKQFVVATDRASNPMAAVASGGEIPVHCEYSIKTKSGEVRAIAWNNTILRDTAKNVVGTASLGEDITDRKRSAEALRASEARFRQLAENIHEVFWMTDVGGRNVLYLSPGYERIWARSCASVYAEPWTWREAIHPDDRGRVMAAVVSKQVSGEYDETYRILRPDGSVRWIRDQAYPVSESGVAVRIVGIAEDITDRKQLEAQFLRAQRMEAIGTLAGGVAHDLNNILAPMLMAAGLLKERMADAHDRDMLEMVERSARRGAEIIRQLLTFSRGVEGAHVAIQPRHLLKELANIINETFPKDIVLEVDASPDLWTVVADATQVHQVLVNLCVNARDAMPNGGTLKIVATNVELDSASAAANSDVRPGPYLKVAVSDTGEGIQPEILSRIFDPFFTTKQIGKGTGLGLSTALGIVRSHGGFLTVESEPGQGTVFDIYLPAQPVSPDIATELPPAEIPLGDGELILVVDDEESVRETVTRALERFNYLVIAANEGREAIELFMQHRERVRLVFTDLMMPAMGGIALVRALRALEPGMKFIATSGLESLEKRAELAELGVSQMLLKPCGPLVLLQAIHAELGSGK